jgi:multiple sugar transport system ATP-binding protein
MATVELRRVVKRFGAVMAVQGVDLFIADKEFVVLVGPSGCGKSTILRMIAGLEDISGGEILIDGKVVNELEPKSRNIAMVFQDYALYPHLTVAQNMSFGLENQKISKADIRIRVAAAAGILGLGELMDRKPRQLSGGQRQRVAMGRAIVRHPKVFLFDEPLSNLDAKLRGQMRTEIKKLHQRVATTIVFVTHDQVEAMTLADRVVVLKDGVVEQIGTPDEVYHNPASVFVAGFIGMPTMNFLTATVSHDAGKLGLPDGSMLAMPARRRSAMAGLDTVIVGIRPENFRIANAHGAADLSVTVDVIEPLGSDTLVFFRIGEEEAVARVPPKLGLGAGDTLRLSVDAEAVHFFNPLTKRALGGGGA